VCGVGVWHALDSGRRAAYAISATLADDPDALAEYQREEDEAYQSYRAELKKLYRRNPRWADAPFWCRRRED
jgi:hypothetical protein